MPTRHFGPVLVRIFILCVFPFIASEKAHAHLKWLVSAEDAERFSRQEFAWNTSHTMIIVGALLVCAAASIIHVLAAKGHFTSIQNILEKAIGNVGWPIITILSGVMLLGNSLMGTFLAPNIHIENSVLSAVLLVTQGALGTLLIIQAFYAISGILILVVVLLTCLLVPMTTFIDYLFEFLFLGLALVCVSGSFGDRDRRLLKKLGFNPDQLNRFAIPFIRLAMGISLIILGFHNKIMHPEYGMAFLEKFHYNFMPLLGFKSFSNSDFVFASGVAEITLGALLTFGIAIRFSTVLLTIFVLFTAATIGLIELWGHLPLIGIAVLLITKGGGSLRASSDKGASLAQGAPSAS